MDAQEAIGTELLALLAIPVYRVVATIAIPVQARVIAVRATLSIHPSPKDGPWDS